MYQGGRQVIKDVITGITDAIYEAFGDDYEIYTEDIEQGMKEPCFLVKCISPQKDVFLGNRYQESYQCVIHYFPHTQKPLEEINDVIEQLIECLGGIYIASDFVFGMDMNAETEDHVLHFFVSYRFFTYSKNAGPAMAQIKMKGGMKDGR
jgi:hypothetical protein